MKIYVDADSCPKVIKEILYKTAHRHKIVLILVANQFMNTPESEFIEKIIVKEGADVADDKIVELITDDDLAITADIPLADRVVEKDSVALNPRGFLYTKENIKPILSNRNFLTDLRNNGLITGGPAPFSQKDVHNFANKLESFLVKYKKKN